jgi:ketosteroid isomerase-like protein
VNAEWVVKAERALAADRKQSSERGRQAARVLSSELAMNLDRAFAPDATAAPEALPETDAPAADAGASTGSKDDVSEVREAVFRYLQLLNAGDVAARASCSLSDSTSFGVEGGPLSANVLDWRGTRPETSLACDLSCRDLRVYIHNDTAIATGYVVGTVAGRNGTPRRVTGRGSWVHLRQNGEWKLAHNHLSPLKATPV